MYGYIPFKYYTYLWFLARDFEQQIAVNFSLKKLAEADHIDFTTTD